MFLDILALIDTVRRKASDLSLYNKSRFKQLVIKVISILCQCLAKKIEWDKRYDDAVTRKVRIFSLVK